MATYVWTLQGTSPTTIDATDKIQFAGAGGFDTNITVNEYNGSTHVESSVGANDSSGNTPKNSKFISQTGGTGGDSQVDIGGGTVDLDTISTANSPLKINFSHGSAVAITNHILYGYADGGATTDVPVGVDFRLAQQADANWTQAEGSAAALGVTDSGSNTSHDFYFLLSASPTSVGAKVFTIRDELTYS